MKVRDIMTARQVEGDISPRQTPLRAVLQHAEHPLPTPCQEDATQPVVSVVSSRGNEERVAVQWLHERLAVGPRLISELIAEWHGSVQHPERMTTADRRAISERLEPLLQARLALSVAVHVGEDGRSWWRLPGGQAC